MSNLVTRPRAIFQQIQANLKDRYSSGFPVLKELIQNAEDSKATRIHFIAHNGWIDAHNPLLRVPGLLVSNNGSFSEKDGQGILSFADSAKGGDSSAIGRFGFGQKAVFHLCDAFIVHAVGHSARFSEVVNPCLGVIENTKASSWDTIGAEDLVLLENAAPRVKKGLLLWIPLRREDIFPAPKLTFVPNKPTLNELTRDFLKHRDELHLTLAGLRHLDVIELWISEEPVFSISRDNSAARINGFGSPSSTSPRSFNGTINEAGAASTRYVGREAIGNCTALEALRESSGWPESPVYTEIGEVMKPEKAEVHAAVLLVDRADGVQTSVDWAVFLPVGTSMLLQTERASVRMMLHGYFFVDSGRRYIEGFDSSNPETIQSEWNRLLRDEVLLPMVPAAIFDAFEAGLLSDEELVSLLRALQRSNDFGQKYRRAVASRHTLACVVVEGEGKISTAWRLLDSDSQLRWVPGINDRGKFTFIDILPDILQWAGEQNLVLATRTAALCRFDPNWEPHEVEALLSGLTHRVFLQGGNANALVELLEDVVGQNIHLRNVVGDQLIILLRKALMDEKNLASEEELRAMLSYIPRMKVIGLPRSAARSRSVLRYFASARNAPLCITSDLLPDGTVRSNLDPAEAAALLQAIQPLLEHGTEYEVTAAAAATLRIIMLLGRQLSALLQDSRYRHLPILKASNGSGLPILVSLNDLVNSSREKRLFRHSNNAFRLANSLHDAAPNRGVLIVGPDEADLLQKIGNPFVFENPTRENFAKLILAGDEFGTAEARENYLKENFTETPETRMAMRSMVAGQVCDDSVRLCALNDNIGRLATVANELIASENQSVLIAPTILRRFSKVHLQFIDVHEIKGGELGELLCRNVSKLTATLLSDEAILEIIQSDIPYDLLRRLPIFPSKNGRRFTADRIWREDRGYRVPRALEEQVPIVRRFGHDESDEKIERLVPLWTRTTLINVALAQPQPHLFAKEILEALSFGADFSPEMMKSKKWLSDRNGVAWAPNKIFDLPKEILSAARQIFPLGGQLGFLPIDEISPDFSFPDNIKTLRKYNILPDDRGSIEQLKLLIESVRPIAVIGKENQSINDLEMIANSGFDLGLPGWPLLAALLSFPSCPGDILSSFGDESQSDIESVQLFLAALEKPIDSSKCHDSAWSVYRVAMKTIGQWDFKERQALFHKIRVRTVAETWEEGVKTAWAGSGIASGNLLHHDLRESLPPSDLNEVPNRPLGPIEDGKYQQSGVASENGLMQILRFARSEVPHDMLLLLVGLVDRSDPLRQIARECLNVTDEDITRIWGMIEDDVEVKFTPGLVIRTVAGMRSARRVKFEPVSTPPRIVEIETLAGTRALVPTGELQALEVLGGAQSNVKTIWLGDRNVREFTLRVATFSGTRPTSTGAKALCVAVCEALGGDRNKQAPYFEALGLLADKCDRLDQATVESASAELEDRLPQVLDELKPKPGSELWEARKLYQNKIESSPVGKKRETVRQAAKQELWNQVATSVKSVELLAAVRQRIEDYGYDSSRVFFELFQNADDAALQHPIASCDRFCLLNDGNRFRVTHWGRLINHPGPVVEDGIRKGWRSDLFNMLLMNLSDKQGEVTGRFGLGFKSVHSLSSRVSIASHFVSCRIIGGMLPAVWTEGRELSVALGTGGRPATIIELEIDSEKSEDADSAYDTFFQSARWLPAMSRAIRSVEIEGNGEWRVEIFKLRADGISLVSFKGNEPGYALALELGINTTIFLPIDSQGPIPAQVGLARLWVLAPLAESFASGWLLNARGFRVDPGRSRLAGSREEHIEEFQKFGKLLGERLVSLFDLMMHDWEGLSELARFSERSENQGPSNFLRSLGELFRLDQSDPLARHLHSIDRGFGRLISERPALESGLPKPFKSFLLASDARYVISGVIDNQRLLVTLGNWRAIEKIGEFSVSNFIASEIEKLGFSRPRTFKLVDLLGQEVEESKKVDPVTAHRLGAIVNDAILKAADKEEEEEILTFLSGLKFLMSDGSWQKAALPPSAAEDCDQEEQRILKFAPEKNMAERSYKKDALGFYRLAMRRSGFGRGAEALQQWANSADNYSKQQSVLLYLLNGGQSDSLCRLLGKERPKWLPETSDEFRESALGKSISHQDLPSLLGKLYPVENQKLWNGAVQYHGHELNPSTPDSAIFLRRLHDWWKQNHQDERLKYDNLTYPPGFHPGMLNGSQEAELSEGWFTFFALAIFRTIGRTRGEAHRGFIVLAQQAGWWKDMACAKLPADPRPWLRNLEDFARSDVGKISYPQWRRVLADLYVLRRWLPDYIDAYLNLPKVLRKREGISLKDTWRISLTDIWQSRGLEAAPLTQSLGLGANWLIREGIRANLWEAEEKQLLVPYGWSSTSRVRDLCWSQLGFDLGETSDMDNTRKLFKEVERHLHEDAIFLGDLDLPLQIVSDGRREDVLFTLIGSGLAEQRSPAHFMDPDYDYV